MTPTRVVICEAAAVVVAVAASDENRLRETAHLRTTHLREVVRRRVRAQVIVCACGSKCEEQAPPRPLRSGPQARAFMLTLLLLQKWKMFWPTLVSSVNR